MMRVKLMHTRDFSVGLALLALVIGLELGSQFMHGRTFFDAYNIARISRDFSFVGIAAIGAVMVIVSGGVDLSAGSVMGLSAVTFAALYTLQKWSAPLCLAGAISVGGLAGFVNGALIGYAGLPPFIATLGMMSIAAGLSYMFTQGLNISILWKEDPPSVSIPLQMLGDHSFIFMHVLCVAAAIILSRTVWGRYVYALGSNEECSRFSGLNVPWIKIGIYTLPDFSAGWPALLMRCDTVTRLLPLARDTNCRSLPHVSLAARVFRRPRHSYRGHTRRVHPAIFERRSHTLRRKEEYVQIVYGLTIVIAVALDHLRGKSLFRKS